MKDTDLIPGVDYQKQQHLIEMADRGDLTLSQHDYLVRLAWPRCCVCGAVSVGTIGKQFYCWSDYKDAFHQHKARGQ